MRGPNQRSARSPLVNLYNQLMRTEFPKGPLLFTDFRWCLYVALRPLLGVVQVLYRIPGYVNPGKIFPKHDIKHRWTL